MKATVRSILGLVIVSLGCADIPDLPEVTFGTFCDQSELDYCDISSYDCQKRYADYLACLREEEPMEPPSSRVITREEFSSGEDYDFNEDYKAYLNQLGEGVRHLFLHHGPTMLGDVAEARHGARALAFYSYVDKEMVFIDSGGSFSGHSAATTLAHELNHAFQDRRHDLTAYFEDSGEHRYSDRSLAMLSLVEGEARMYQYMVSAALYGHDIWWDYDTLWFELGDPRFGYSGMAEFVGLPYEAGHHWVQHLWYQGQMDAVAEAFASPPTTMAEIFTKPGTQSADYLWHEPITEEAELPDELEDYELVSDSSLGVTSVITSFLRAGTWATPREIADGWLGDRLFVYRHTEANNYVALWRLRWRPELVDDQGALAIEFYSSADSWLVTTDFQEMTIVAGAPESEVTAWESLGLGGL